MGSRNREAYARELGTRSGHRSASALANWAVVSGCSSTSSRPAARSSARSTPTRSFANGLLFHARSSTSCSTGRRARKSRAVIRCSVVRSVLPRTARRSSMRVLQLLRVEPLDPAPQRQIRVGRLLGLHADEMLDDVLGRPIDPLQQQLPPQQGPVERAPAEHRRAVLGSLRHRPGPYRSPAKNVRMSATSRSGTSRDGK